MKNKKSISFIIAICMLFSLLPHVATATNTKSNNIILSLSYDRSAILSDGNLWEFGCYKKSNESFWRTRNIPEKTMNDVISVSLGYDHYAVIKENGDLYLWGSNTFGGIGKDVYGYVDTPVKVMENVRSVSLGTYHSAAIKNDGSLWMWGHNQYGQLGDGTNTNRSTPVKIMDDVDSVSIGGHHSAAIKNDGSLWVWGYNDVGQLGDGSNERKNTPVKIMDDVFLVKLTSNGGESAAINKDGTLFMWGGNHYGQLLNGTKKHSNVPIEIMNEVKDVALGGGSCAIIKNDNSLWTWGCGSSGQLGNGYNEDSITPTKVMENVYAISVGTCHSAAIKNDGTLWTWGCGSSGQLGNGYNEDSIIPTKVMENIIILTGNKEENTEPLPNTTRSISSKFIGGQDIVYNADNNCYSVNSFTLIGTLENLWQLDDWNREDYSAHNIKMELTLPEGFSFEQNSDVQSKTYLFEEIIYTDNITDTIYLSNPPVGKSQMSVKISGDNIEETNTAYEFNIDKYEFQIDIYRAKYLTNSKTGSIMEDTYINIGRTPCKILYDAGQENGLDNAVAAWDAVMNSLDVVDNPASIADYALEEKDMYEAYYELV